MEKFPSKDGTLLTYQRSGSGLPLVLIHGTGATAARWTPVLPALERHFTVYALNRRGRSGSGDTPPYFLTREIEDVAAFIRAIGRPVNVLGHSYGGICALEAALNNSRIQKLILYEPPIPTEVTTHSAETIERLEALLAHGDREGVLTTFVKEVLHMPEADFEIFRASPMWSTRVATANLLPREMRAQAGYHFNAERFKNFAVPSLLLTGELSQERFHVATDLLAKTLPDRQVVMLVGQKHNAMDTAPDLFVKEVLNFLQE